MDPISELAAWNHLVADFKAQHKKTETNCYMFPDDIIRYAKLGRIYSQKCSDALLIFCDEEDYFHLYYYISWYAVQSDRKELARSFGKAVKKAADGKPVIIRMISREDKSKEGAFLKEQFFLLAGFQIRDVTLQMCVRPSQKQEHIEKNLKISLRFLERHGFHLEDPYPCLLPEIRKLRDLSLDALHFPYSTQEELNREILNGHFQCIFNAERELCAVHQFEVIKGKAYGHVIAVREDYRRFGLGPVLVYRFLDLMRKEGITACYCWVIRENLPSLQMHKKVGFLPTGKCSIQMILD